MPVTRLPLLLVVALIACGEDPKPRDDVSDAVDVGRDVEVVAHDNPSGSGAVTRVTVGPEGGVLAVGRLTLDIPPGALLEPTELTATELVRPAPDTLDALLPLYQLEPSGLTFERAVTATLRVDSGPGLAFGFWSERGDGGDLQPVMSERDGDLVRFRVHHFSFGGAATDAVINAMLADFEAFANASENGAAAVAAAAVQLSADLLDYVLHFELCKTRLSIIAALASVLPHGVLAKVRDVLFPLLYPVVATNLECLRGHSYCSRPELADLAAQGRDLSLLDALGLLSGSGLANQLAAHADTYVTHYTCAVSKAVSCARADLLDRPLRLLDEALHDETFPFTSVLAELDPMANARLQSNVACAADLIEGCSVEGLGTHVSLATDVAELELLTSPEVTEVRDALATPFLGAVQCVADDLDTCGEAEPDLVLDAMRSLNRAVLDAGGVLPTTTALGQQIVSLRVVGNLECVTNQHDGCVDGVVDPGELDRLSSYARMAEGFRDEGLITPSVAALFHVELASRAQDAFDCLIGRLDTCADELDHEPELRALHASVTATDFAFPELRAFAATRIEEGLIRGADCQLVETPACLVSEVLDPSELDALEQVVRAIDDWIADGLVSVGVGAAARQRYADEYAATYQCYLAAYVCTVADPTMYAEELARLRERIHVAGFPLGGVVPTLDAETQERLNNNLGCALDAAKAAAPSRAALDAIAGLDQDAKLFGDAGAISAEQRSAFRSQSGQAFEDMYYDYILGFDACSREPPRVFVEELVAVRSWVRGEDLWFDERRDTLLIMLGERVAFDMICMISRNDQVPLGKLRLYGYEDIEDAIDAIEPTGLFDDGDAAKYREELRGQYAATLEAYLEALDSRCAVEAATNEEELLALNAAVTREDFSFPELRSESVSRISWRLYYNLSCEAENLADLPATVAQLATFVEAAEKGEWLYADGYFIDIHHGMYLDDLERYFGDQLRDLVDLASGCAPEPIAVNDAALAPIAALIGADGFVFPDSHALWTADIQHRVEDNVRCVIDDLQSQSASLEALVALASLKPELLSLVGDELLALDAVDPLTVALSEAWTTMLAAVLDGYDGCAADGELYRSALRALHDHVDAPDFAFPLKKAAALADISERLVDNLMCFVDELATLPEGLAKLNGLEGVARLARQLEDEGSLGADQRTRVVDHAAPKFFGALVAYLSELDGCPSEVLFVAELTAVRGVLDDPELAFEDLRERSREEVGQRLSDNFECELDRIARAEDSYDLLVQIELWVDRTRAQSDLFVGAQLETLREYASDEWWPALIHVVDALDGCGETPVRMNVELLGALRELASSPEFVFPEHEELALEYTSDQLFDNLGCALEDLAAREPTQELLVDLEVFDETAAILMEEGHLSPARRADLKSLAASYYETVFQAVVDGLESCSTGVGLGFDPFAFVELDEAYMSPAFSFPDLVPVLRAILREKILVSFSCMHADSASREPTLSVLRTLSRFQGYTEWYLEEEIISAADRDGLRAEATGAWEAVLDRYLATLDGCDDDSVHEVELRELYLEVTTNTGHLETVQAGARVAISDRLYDNLGCELDRMARRPPSLALLQDIQALDDLAGALAGETILSATRRTQLASDAAATFELVFEARLAALAGCDTQDFLAEPQQLAEMVLAGAFAFPDARVALMTSLRDLVADNIDCYLETFLEGQRSLALLEDIDGFERYIDTYVGLGMLDATQKPPLLAHASAVWQTAFADYLALLDGCGASVGEHAVELRALVTHVRDIDYTDRIEPALAAVADRLYDNLGCELDRLVQQGPSDDVLLQIQALDDTAAAFAAERLLSAQRRDDFESDASAAFEVVFAARSAQLTGCTDEGANTDELGALSRMVLGDTFAFPDARDALMTTLRDAVDESVRCYIDAIAARPPTFEGVVTLDLVEVLVDDLLGQKLLVTTLATAIMEYAGEAWLDVLTRYVATLNGCGANAGTREVELREVVAHVREATYVGRRGAALEEVSDRLFDNLGCALDALAQQTPAHALLADVQTLDDTAAAFADEGVLTSARREDFRADGGGVYEALFGALLATLTGCTSEDARADELEVLLAPTLAGSFSFPAFAGSMQTALRDVVSENLHCYIDALTDGAATLDLVATLDLIPTVSSDYVGRSLLDGDQNTAIMEHGGTAWEAVIARYLATLDGCGNSPGSYATALSELAAQVRISDYTSRQEAALGDVSDRLYDNLGCALDALEQGAPSTTLLADIQTLDDDAAAALAEGGLSATRREDFRGDAGAAYEVVFDAVLATSTGCTPGDTNTDALEILAAPIVAANFNFPAYAPTLQTSLRDVVTDNVRCYIDQVADSGASLDLLETLNLLPLFVDELLGKEMLDQAQRDALVEHGSTAWQETFETYLAALDACGGDLDEVPLRELLDHVHAEGFDYRERIAGAEAGVAERIYLNLGCGLAEKLRCDSEGVAAVGELDAIVETLATAVRLAADDVITRGQLDEAETELPGTFATSFACLQQRFDACLYAPHDLFFEELVGMLARIEAPDFVFADQTEDLKETLRVRMTGNAPCAIAFASQCDVLGPALEPLEELETIGLQIRDAGLYELIAEDQVEPLFEDAKAAYHDEFGCVVRGLDACDDADDIVYLPDLSLLMSSLEDPDFVYPELTPELQLDLQDQAFHNVQCERARAGSCGQATLDKLEDLGQDVLDLRLEDLLDAIDEAQLMAALKSSFGPALTCTLASLNGCNKPGTPLNQSPLLALRSFVAAERFAFHDDAATYLAAIRQTATDNLVCAIKGIDACAPATPQALVTLETDTVALYQQSDLFVRGDEPRITAAVDAKQCQALGCQLRFAGNAIPLSLDTEVLITDENCPVQVQLTVGETDPLLPAVEQLSFRVNELTYPPQANKEIGVQLQKGKHMAEVIPLVPECPDLRVPGKIAICCGVPPGETCKEEEMPTKYGKSYASGPSSPPSSGGSPRGPVLRRPTYSEPSANAWGDPHLTTADGNGWTSYVLGEFVYRHSEIDGAMQIQARHARLPGFQGWASFIVAIAIRAGDTTLEVRMPRNAAGAFDLTERRPLELVLDGVVVDLAPGTYALSSALAFTVGQGGGVHLSYQDPASTSASGLATVEIGTKAELGLLRSDFDPSEPVLSLDLELEGQGLWRGVMGTPNGDAEDDFLLPDGSDAEGPSAPYMDAWRVADAAESLFTYPDGESPATWNIEQVSSLPSSAALTPFFARVDALLTDRCGLTPEAVGDLEYDFPGYRRSIAIELAAGRTEKNLVANGLCTDARLAPPPPAVVAGIFSGKAYYASRPSLGLGGATVKVSARDPSSGAAYTLCDSVTAPDGFWSCYTTMPEALVDEAIITMEASGRGPDVTVQELVWLPEPGEDAVEVTGDFALTPLRVLEVSGHVIGRSGLAEAGAPVAYTGLGTGRDTADSEGRFHFALALPDGLARGVLEVSALARGSAGTTTTPFDTLPLGVTMATIDVTIGAAPAVLPLPQPVFYAVVQGRVLNQTVTETVGLDAPVAGARVALVGDGWRDVQCLGASDRLGRFGCLASCRRADVERCMDGLTLEVDGEAAFEADVATLDGDRYFAPDIRLARSTLAVSGRLQSGQGAPLAGATVTLRTLDGVVGDGVSDGAGSYRVYLTGPARAWQGTVLAEWRWAAGAGADALLEVAEATFDVAAERVGELTLDATLDGRTLALTGRIVNDHLPSTSPFRGVGEARVVVSAEVPGVPDSRTVVCDTTSTVGFDPAVVGFYRCEVRVPRDVQSWTLTWDVSGAGSATASQTLDVASIASGAVFPIAKSFAVAPSTLIVAGTVRDSGGRVAAGASVGVVVAIGARRDATALTKSDGSGHYTSVVSLPDAVMDLGAGLLEVEATWGANELVRSGRAARAIDPDGSAQEVSADIVLSGTIPADDEVARVELAGFVSNSHVPGAGVPGVTVTVRGADDDSALGVVCSAVTGADGAYGCERMLAAPEAQVTLTWTTTLGGATLSTATATTTLVRSSVFVNHVVRDLQAAPTTLRLSGKVGAGAGEPFAGATVNVTGTPAAWVRGSATTDAQGSYDLVLVFADGIDSASGTLGVTALGETASASFSASLVPRAVVAQSHDLDFPFYRMTLGGSVDNTRALGALVPGADVAISADGRVVCRATSTRAGFTCAAPLRRTPADGPLNLDWVVTIPGATSGGTHAVPVAQLPAPGGVGDVALETAIAAPALDLSGHVRDSGGDGVPGQEVAIVLDKTVTRTTNNNGRYQALLSFPAPLQLEVTASATRELISASATKSITVGDALVSDTLDLAFPLATQLRLSGVVRNGNSALALLTNGQLRLEGSAPSLPRRTLCELSTSGASYGCDVLIADQDLAALTLHATWSRGGVVMAPTLDVPLTNLTPGLNTIVRDLPVTPTTIAMSGRVTNGSLGLAGATVTLDAIDATFVTTTDSAGQWARNVVVPPTTTQLVGTLSATRAGLESVIALDAPLAPLGRTTLTQDHVLANRAVTLRGRLVSRHADVGVRDQRLVASVDGVEVCDTYTFSTGAFQCEPFERSDASAFTITWATSGDYVADGGALEVAAGELPGPGQQGFVDRTLAVDVTTLALSGTLTKNGATVPNGSVTVTLGTTVSGATATNASGAWSLVMAVPLVIEQASLTLLGSDLADTVTRVVDVALTPAELTAAVVDLAIETGNVGASAWNLSLPNPSDLELRREAPPAYDAASGRLYAATARALTAIDAATGDVLWTSSWPTNEGIVASNVTLADGFIWLATSTRLQVFTDLGSGASRSAHLLGSSHYESTLMPTSDGRLIVYAVTRVIVFDRASRVRLSSAFVPGWDDDLDFAVSSGAALHPDGTLLVNAFSHIQGLNLTAQGPTRRFDIHEESALVYAPVIDADGLVVSATSRTLRRMRTNGTIVNDLALSGSGRSHPTLTPEGDVLLVGDGRLRRYHPDGDTFVVTLDAALDASSEYGNSAPLVVGDIAYVTASAFSATRIHAIRLAGADAGLPAFPAYLAPGERELTAPTAIDGAVVAMSRSAVVAITRPAGDMVGPWPKLGRDVSNDFGLPLVAESRRFVRVTGTVVNTNAPDVVLPARVRLGDPVVAETSSDQGVFDAGGPTSELGALALEVSASAYGASVSETLQLAAGPADSVTSATQSFALPVTTLVITGTATYDGALLGERAIELDTDAALVVGGLETSADGTYRLTALFDASVTSTTVTVRVAGASVTQTIALAPNGLTSVALDPSFEPVGEQLDLLPYLPGEYPYVVGGTSDGNAAFVLGMLAAGCDESGCEQLPTLLRVADDDTVTTTDDGFAPTRASFYTSAPTVDAFGRVYVMFSGPAIGARSGLMVYDPALARTFTIDLDVAELGVSAPAVVATGATSARVYVVLDVDWVGSGELVAWDIDFALDSYVEHALPTPVVPGCERCVMASAERVVVASTATAYFTTPALDAVSEHAIESYAAALQGETPWIVGPLGLAALAPDGTLGAPLAVCDVYSGLTIAGATAWLNCGAELVEVSLGPTPSVVERLAIGVELMGEPLLTTGHITLMTPNNFLVRLVR